MFGVFRPALRGRALSDMRPTCAARHMPVDDGSECREDSRHMRAECLHAVCLVLPISSVRPRCTACCGCMRVEEREWVRCP